MLGDVIACAITFVFLSLILSSKTVHIDPLKIEGVMLLRHRLQIAGILS